MRIATVCGVLALLAGCNQLPADSLSNDDQGLRDKAAAADGGTAGGGDVANASSEAAPSGVAECELKAKDCYANGGVPEKCDFILKMCQPPAPAPAPCAEDCDTSVRNCFAKGIDAKTCDAMYHACLSPQPGKDPNTDPGKDPNVEPGKDPNSDPNSDPNKDPNIQCMITAKECYANGGLPEKCDALLALCL